MIKQRISEQIFLDALYCETIVTDRAGKIFRANRDHSSTRCPAKLSLRTRRAKSSGQKVRRIIKFFRQKELTEID